MNVVCYYHAQLLSQYLFQTHGMIVQTIIILLIAILIAIQCHIKIVQYFFLLPYVLCVVQALISISSTCWIKFRLMMEKFNISGYNIDTNNTNTHSNTRGANYFDTNGNNITTSSQFTDSSLSRLLLVAAVTDLCKTALMLNVIGSENTNKCVELLLSTYESSNEQLSSGVITLECTKMSGIGVAFEFSVAV